MKHARTLVAAATLALLLLAAFVVRDGLRLVGEPFPGFIVWENGTLAAFHASDWTGVRAGMPLNGGRIVAVDGRPFAGARALLARARAGAPGEVMHYRILHRGRVDDYAVPLMRMGWRDWLTTFGNYLVNALAFASIGLVALVLRPDLAVARALAASMLLFGTLMLLTVDFFTSYRFVAACQMVEAASPAAFAALGLVFPVPRLSARARRVAIPGLYAVFLGIGAANVMLFHEDPERARVLTSTVYLSVAAIALAMLVSFAHALRNAKQVRARVQAAVVFVGALVAFLLPSLLVVAFFPLGLSFSFTWITLPLLFFPISILYAIVRHELLDAERFIRTTLGYSVTTSALILAYAGVALAIDRLVAPGAHQNAATAMVLLVLIAIAFDPIRRRVQAVVDRVFYRSSLDPARVLEASGTELLTLAEEGSIVRHAEELLTDSLKLEWARFARAAPDGPGPPATPGPAAHEEPVRVLGEELGALRVGPKRSGAPTSAAERELVRGVAAQLALALRNARSIADLRRTQEQLFRSERLAALGEFAGAVAHGVRNPLAGIRAAAQVALAQADPGPEREALDGVIRETDRLEQRMRTLLDFSRPFEPRLAQVELAPLLGSVAETLGADAKRRQVELRVETEAGLEVESDADYLEEVLLELAGNALRAMGTGGRLTLSAHRTGSGARLRVADTGPGIPEGVRDRIFDLFFTTRPDGTGLGLASARRILDRLGGSIELERSGADGTVFRIELPGARDAKG